MEPNDFLSAADDLSSASPSLHVDPSTFTFEEMVNWGVNATFVFDNGGGGGASIANVEFSSSRTSFDVTFVGDDASGNISDAGTAAGGLATMLDEMPRFNQISMMKTVVLLLMFVVSFAANGATLVRMFRQRRRRSTINLLIAQLAGADLIVTFFCNVTDAVWTATVQWYAGNAACKVLKFLQVGGYVRRGDGRGVCVLMERQQFDARLSCESCERCGASSVRWLRSIANVRVVIFLHNLYSSY